MLLRKKENIISGIYCIENKINHKKYVGQSVDIYTRWTKHRNELKRKCHDNEHLQRSWDKYGEENFEFYILEKCEEKLLNKKEIFYINSMNLLDGNFGYNQKEGGNCGRISEEANNKKKESLKKFYKENPDAKLNNSKRAYEQWANPEIKSKIIGENNGMYGRTHTEEARKKISEAQKGHISKYRNLTPVLCVELNKIYDCAVNACVDLKIKKEYAGMILEVCRGNGYRKTVGGYHWKFLENNI